MKDAIEICKGFLGNKYQQMLDINVADFGSENEISDERPVWQGVDDDLNPLVNDDSADSGGLLLDPEIGMCVYFLLFKPQKTDTAGQIIRALQIRSKLLPEIHYADRENSKVDDKGSWRVLIPEFCTKLTCSNGRVSFFPSAV